MYVWYFRFKIYNIDSSLGSELSMAVCSDEGSDSTSHVDNMLIGPPHAASSSLVIEGTGDHDDISFFANRSNVPSSHDALYAAYSKPYVPEERFEFPYSTSGRQKQRFVQAWFRQFPWLTYSKSLDGGFCKVCVFFASDDNCKGGRLSALVRKPYRSYHRALQDFKSHQCTEYHKIALTKAESFVSVMNKTITPVDEQLGLILSQTIANNRLVLKSIFDIIITCGRQNIALRGHRESVNGDNELNNPGNFLELIKFRVRSGDKILENHLKSAPKNALYTSKTIQNECIDICHDHILKIIKDEVLAAKYFTIIADEVQDVSHCEQLSIILRYVSSAGPKEKFVGFVEIKRDMSGKAIATAILKYVTDLGLNIENIRGQGYDGSGSMMGRLNGAASIIKRQVPLAIPVHCNSHVLNLCIVSACSVVAIRNMMGIVTEVSFFFQHRKRKDKLEEVIQHNFPDQKRKKLIDLCRTRWVERHNALEVFLKLYPATVQALDDIATRQDSVSWNAESIKNASCLLVSVSKFDFLFSLVICANILGYIKGLSIKLQGRSLDIIEAISMIQSVTVSLKALRNDVDTWHSQWFAFATDTAKDVETDLPSIPRRYSRQQHRSNVEGEDPSTYLKRIITIPFLDHIIQEMEVRFSSSAQLSSKCLLLLPDSIISEESFSEWNQKVKEVTELYACDIAYQTTLESELHRWYMKWKNVNSSALPSAKEVYHTIDADFFPSIQILMKILLTLPVTSCEAERSFSLLKRLKTYLRNTTDCDRLNGLALLSIHRDIDIIKDIDLLIDIFANKHPRRIRLSNLLL